MISPSTRYSLGPVEPGVFNFFANFSRFPVMRFSRPSGMIRRTGLPMTACIEIVLLANYVWSRAFSFSFDVLIPYSIDFSFDSGSPARWDELG